jgi:hypothetical protein
MGCPVEKLRIVDAARSPWISRGKFGVRPLGFAVPASASPIGNIIHPRADTAGSSSTERQTRINDESSKNLAARPGGAPGPANCLITIERRLSREPITYVLLNNG